MRIKFCFFIFFFMILVSSIGNAESWFSSSVAKVKGLTQSVTDSIENIFGKKVKNIQTLHDFQETSDALQEDIKTTLEGFQNKPTMSDLAKAQELLNKLYQEQEVVLQQAEQELSSEDFALLHQKVKEQQVVINNEISKLAYISKLWNIFKQSATAYTKKQLNIDNPYKTFQAKILRDNGMPKEEQEYRQARFQHVKQALEIFFHQSLQDEQVFNLAFAGSGGGYRAMILTLGYLLGLQQLGLYDALLYSSSLSGATWCQAPQIQLKKTLKEYKDYLLERIRAGRFDLTSMQYILSPSDMKAFVNNVVWPKFIFGLPLGSIDLYGNLLSRVFLSEALDYQKLYLPDQLEFVGQGNVPFPIYTAISMHKLEGEKYLYNWYEFNPVEIRNLELNISLPSYSFGWHFNQGISEEAAPLASLGYLMGIWGSAFSVNLKDLKSIVLEELQDAESRGVKDTAANLLLRLLGDTPYIGLLRFSPAQVNNPFKNMSDLSSWIANRPYLVFIDGGIAYNIPLRPLWKKDRKLQVIIVGDSSSTVPKTIELQKAFADAKRFYGYAYQRVDDRQTETMHIYKDFSGYSGPAIIYISYAKDEALLEQARQTSSELAFMIDRYRLDSFNVADCLSKGYCGTFNLGNYTEEQFLQLMHMAVFNVLANGERIRNFLRDEFNIINQ